MLVGVRLGVLVKVKDGFGEGDGFSEISGVRMATFSSVGKAATKAISVPSVKESNKLPSTITIEVPAIITPRITLLIPENRSFTSIPPAPSHLYHATLQSLVKPNTTESGVAVSALRMTRGYVMFALIPGRRYLCQNAIHVIPSLIG